MTLEIKDIYKVTVYKVEDTRGKKLQWLKRKFMKVGDGIDCKSALCPVAGITGGVELPVSDKRKSIQQASDELRNCACLNNVIMICHFICHRSRGAHWL